MIPQKTLLFVIRCCKIEKKSCLDEEVPMYKVICIARCHAKHWESIWWTEQKRSIKINRTIMAILLSSINRYSYATANYGINKVTKQALFL